MDHQELIQKKEEFLSKYRGVWLADLVQKPPPPWLFDGFLRDKSITLINAEPYSGKTMLQLAMLIALEYDKPLFNRFHPTHSRSGLFIGGGDAADWDYGGQARKLMRGMGLTDAQMCEAHIPILPYEGPKLTDIKFAKWLMEFYELDPFDILFIDTLLSVHDVNENDAQAMRMVFAVLKQLRDQGVNVIVGHHDSKMQEGKSGIYRPRGSSVISGSVDFMFSLKKTQHAIEFVATKARGIGLFGTPIESFSMNEHLIDGKEAITLEVADDEVAIAILGMLASGPMARSELIEAQHPSEAEAAQVGRRTDTALRTLRKQGKISQPRRGWWQLKEAECSL